MEPLEWIALASALASVGGGIAGKITGDQDRDKANALLDKAYHNYDGFDATQLGPSSMQGVQTDPRYKEAQLRALQQFGNIQQAGGLTLEDQAALSKIQGQLARNESAGRGAIEQNMAARGTLGSGAELAMSLNNQQNSAQRANEAGLNTAAAAQKRYFDSILAQGQMAGQMRTQDFGEQSKIAEAKDAIARYNAEAKDRGNMWRISGQNSVLGQQAGNGRGDAAANQQMWSGIGQGVGAAGSAYGAYQAGKTKAPASGADLNWGATYDPSAQDDEANK